MILLITGASHTGKTALAQRLLYSAKLGRGFFRIIPQGNPLLLFGDV